MGAKVEAEWHKLHRVLMHKPEIEMFIGLLEPSSSLYERYFSYDSASREHDELGAILQNEFHIRVHRLKEEILRGADKSEKAREFLIEHALDSVEFRCAEVRLADKARRRLTKSTEMLDIEHFFNIWILNPVISLRREKRTGEVLGHVTIKNPLSNLYFMRDQQAVTDKGIVLGRMARPQRRRETFITEFCLSLMGYETVSRVRNGTFEGGDFIPLKDFALIGQGFRTNRKGASEIMLKALSFDEVAIVHNPGHEKIPKKEPDQMVTMHLDTYFNVAADGVAVGRKRLLKNANVEVFRRVGPGNYERDREPSNLLDYIEKKDFHVVDITTLEQLSYASNFLCIKNGTILAVDVERIAKSVLMECGRKKAENPQRYGALCNEAEKDYSRLRRTGQFFPHKKELYEHGVDPHVARLSHLTGGYGGVHCMTCVLSRG